LLDGFVYSPVISAFHLFSSGTGVYGSGKAVYGSGKGSSALATDDRNYFDDDGFLTGGGQYPGRSGKGMGMGMGKKSMGKGKKGMGKGKGATDDQVYYDDYYNNDCKLVCFNETFAIPGFTLFLSPDTTVSNPGTVSLPATVFILERLTLLVLRPSMVLRSVEPALERPLEIMAVVCVSL
jgi:hypothetical protein